MLINLGTRFITKEGESHALIYDHSSSTTYSIIRMIACITRRYQLDVVRKMWHCDSSRGIQVLVKGNTEWKDLKLTYRCIHHGWSLGNNFWGHKNKNKKNLCSKTKKLWINLLNTYLCSPIQNRKTHQEKINKKGKKKKTIENWSEHISIT